MKRNNRRSVFILTILAVLLLASLACNLPAIAISRSQTNTNNTPNTEPTLSTEPPVSNAPENSTPFAIALTEGQLNAIIQQELGQQTGETIRDLQLRLQNGQIHLTGAVTQNGLNLPLNLAIEAGTNGQGGITFHVVSASAGPLPLPQSMRDQIEALLNQNLQPVINQLSNNMYIESITISDGVMNVTGHTQ
jgi:uncharacterized protein YpmS